MQIEILEEKQNPLLDRRELALVAQHPKGPTPRRQELAQAIATKLKVNAEVIAVQSIESVFGSDSSKCRVFVYSSKKDLERIEPKYMLSRGLKKEKPKVEKPAEVPKEEVPKEEAKTEEKVEEKKE